MSMIASLRRGLMGAAIAVLAGSPPSAAAGLDALGGHAFFGGGWDYFDPPYDKPHTALAGLLFWSPAYGGLDARLSAGAVWIKETGKTVSTGGRTPAEADLDLDEAWLRWRFPLGPWSASLQGGAFSWRPNPDAIMMGAYPARQGAYPHTVTRKVLRWAAMDSLAVPVDGVRFSLASPGGAYTHEALALLDSLGPRLGYTLAYALSAAPRPGMDWGAALAFNRAAARGGKEAVLIARPTGPNDSLVADTAEVDLDGYSLSARVGLDLPALITGQSARGRAGRLFAEAVLRGLADRPPVYTDPGRRIDLLFGLEGPTFGFLDACRLQVERLSEPRKAYVFFTDGPAWIEPGLLEWQPSSHLWLGLLYLAKDVRSWLVLQGWIGFSLGEEGKDSSDDEVFGGSQYRLFLTGGRLVARF